MLQEAVRRTQECWPEAVVTVLTDDPDGLRRHCPGAVAMSTEGRAGLPSPAGRGRFRSSLLARSGGRDLAASITSSDVVLASGGGGTTDLFPDDGRSLLAVLGLAARAGVCTAMVSQGFGPLEDPGLDRLARSVLPRVDFIAIRDRVTAPALLQRLGVHEARIHVTGDDGIRAARQHTRQELGSDLGVNVRLAAYAGIDDQVAADVGTESRRAGERLGARLRVIPIDLDPVHGDGAVTVRVCAMDQAGGPQSTDPSTIMSAAGDCRVVVTTSYHAAVFALAQGVPAVGVAASTYYSEKFRGLADLFGDGSEVVLVSPGWRERLAGAVDAAWHRAAQLRPPLLQAADMQVALADRGYATLREVAEQAVRRRHRAP